jgi:hypothetical protein
MRATLQTVEAVAAKVKRQHVLAVERINMLSGWWRLRCRLRSAAGASADGHRTVRPGLRLVAALGAH